MAWPPTYSGDSTDKPAAIPPWNHVWTARDVAGWTHRQLIARYIWAVWERAITVNITPIGVDPDNPPSPIISGPNGGPNSAVLGPSIGGFEVGWDWVYQMVQFMAPYFVRKVGLDGVTAWTPDGRLNIDNPFWTVDPDGARGLPFPAPNGWTRRFPREIWTLAYPGIAGQRARFTYRNSSLGGIALGGILGTAYYNTFWFGDLTTSDQFNQPTTTPPDEAKYSGVIMRFNGAAWVVDSDQVTDVDVVTELVSWSAVAIGSQPGNPPFLPYPGDYFGPWVLNDLRDALNQLTVVPTCVSTTYPGSQGPKSYSGLSGPTAGGPYQRAIVPGTGIERQGAGYSKGAAEAAYSASSFASEASSSLMATDYGGSYLLDGGQYSVRIGSVVDGGLTVVDWPNPYNFVAVSTVYGCCIASMQPTQFDAFGTVAQSGKWSMWGSPVTGDPNAVGPIVGYCPATPPAWPDASPGSRGYINNDTVVLSDYDVAGGFAFCKTNGG